jgi:hypothetical protein
VTGDGVGLTRYPLLVTRYSLLVTKKKSTNICMKQQKLYLCNPILSAPTKKHNNEKNLPAFEQETAQ